ncbi:hypothetical protein D3C81_1717560 [compost metagenome]
MRRFPSPLATKCRTPPCPRLAPPSITTKLVATATETAGALAPFWGIFRQRFCAKADGADSSADVRVINGTEQAFGRSLCLRRKIKFWYTYQLINCVQFARRKGSKPLWSRRWQGSARAPSRCNNHTVYTYLRRFLPYKNTQTVEP